MIPIYLREKKSYLLSWPDTNLQKMKKRCSIMSHTWNFCAALIKVAFALTRSVTMRTSQGLMRASGAQKPQQRALSVT